MERKEQDPMRRVTDQLYSFAESINGDVIVKDGDFHIEKGDLRAEIDIDSLGGKVSYELYDGDQKILAQENTNLETIFENIEGRAYPDESIVEMQKKSEEEELDPVEHLIDSTPRNDSDLTAAEAPPVPKDLAA